MVRPLVSIDIESTGTDPAKDRIIQLAMVSARDTNLRKVWVVNPGIPIPAEATECHGITNEMVEQLPALNEYAAEIHKYLRGADLIGFNLTNFDVPLLWEELFRCGIEWHLTDTNIIDVGTLFKKREERTLTAAVKFYCDREHDGAHDATCDALATIQVWERMLDRYPDLKPMARHEQAKASQYEEVRLDLAGKIIVGKDGRPTYNIGKAKGTAVEDDPGFGRWMLDRDFTENTKMVLSKILYPTRTGELATSDIPF